MNANTKCILILPLSYSPSLNVFKWNILTRCTYLLGKFRLHWPSHQYGKSSLGLQARPLMPPLLPQICKHWGHTEPDDSWPDKVSVRCWGTIAAWWETSPRNKALMYSSSEAEYPPHGAPQRDFAPTSRWGREERQDDHNWKSHHNYNYIDLQGRYKYAGWRCSSWHTTRRGTWTPAERGPNIRRGEEAAGEQQSSSKATISCSVEAGTEGACRNGPINTLWQTVLMRCWLAEGYTYFQNVLQFFWSTVKQVQTLQ